MNDFQKFMMSRCNMGSLKSSQIINAQNNSIRNSLGLVNPTIIEERNLNVAVMDVFSRLMMDRIIFLGSEIDDYTANVIQAQLLYLDSNEPGKDISIYINSPGGLVYAGLGIYDTMQYISSDVSTLCTGLAASMASVPEPQNGSQKSVSSLGREVSAIAAARVSRIGAIPASGRYPRL